MRKIVYPKAGGVETIEIVEDADPVPEEEKYASEFTGQE